jgi:hypothetical protein
LGVASSARRLSETSPVLLPQPNSMTLKAKFGALACDA